MKVGQLWQYPVKSMVGTSVEAVELDEAGVLGDRNWAVRDHDSGAIRGAKKIAELMACSAAYDGLATGSVTITLPDGSTTNSASPGCDQTLSEALGRSVGLDARAPATDLDHYRRGAPDTDDVMAELRGIFGREADEPLPDLSVFPPELMEFESPPGSYVDAFPLLVMTTSALRSLAEALPGSVIDVRRFRPSIVIDAGDQPGHPEFDWVGRQLQLGDAVIEIGVPCPRCVMVTRAISESIPADRAVLRHIVAELDQNVGVYASVRKPGAVGVGQGLELSGSV